MDKKWNLQDIKPAQPRKRVVPSKGRPLENTTRKREITEEDDGTMRVGISDGKAKKRSSLVLALIVFFVVFGAGFFVSFLMGGAEITVHPKNREVNVKAVFEARKNPQVDELAYEIISLEADGERQVSASGQEDITTQAEGEIVIYNNTAGTERLKKNTRFETPDGLIYKISESVVVPAAKKTADDTLVPGSISAQVFADGPGEQYNITKTQMTVPGYKEGGYMELFEGIYAENTDPISGGFEGLKFIIDEEELETEKQRLQTELRNALLDRIESEKPAGFVVFDNAVTFTYQSLPAVEYGGDLATIKEKALLQIPIFKQEEFAKFIAKAAVSTYEGEPVRIVDYSTMTFSYTQATTSSSDIGNLNGISFELSGKPMIVWTYDQDRLKADIVGKAKTALSVVLGGHTAIWKADAVVRPFWKRSFPDSLDDITITEVIIDEE
ncbi:MAG: hypothetical protein ACI9VM_000771 [Candidatus Azotimanducaceae bacterium]|jgi:hypothetical protein